MAGRRGGKAAGPGRRALLWLQDLVLRVFLGGLSLLPWRWRLAVAGRLAAHVLAPLFGAERRIRDNLRKVWPDLPADEVRRLCRAVSDASARVMVENFHTGPFLRHARRAPLEGPGVKALLEALEAGRPVVLVSGHFGNYQVLRVLLRERGLAVAGIYRPMNNPFTDARYVAAMDRIATPNHPRGLRGTKALLTHLKRGGAIALLNDQAMREGIPLPFLGRPALTMTSAAEFALKHDALLVPYYGIRQRDGVNFRVEVEAPIPPSDPREMTLALNRSLERMIERHPGQWFWMHRRWKYAASD